jgi:hypothetical protein
MKSKLVLLLIAAVGSTALVASAQTPSAYKIAAPVPDGLQDVVPHPVAVPVPPQPPGAGYNGVTPTSPSMNYTVFDHRPHLFTWKAEESGLSRQAEVFARQLAEAKSDGDREKLKGQLAEVLEKQFDQRQKRHEEEIKQLEAQIKKLKELVDKRQENRREIISSRLNQIVKESQGLGW